jgi:hypothetical protein
MSGREDLGCRDMADTMFTHKLTEAQVLRLRETVTEKGFKLGPLEYGHFSARKGKCVLQMYLSGKLVVAGGAGVYRVCLGAGDFGGGTVGV